MREPVVDSTCLIGLENIGHNAKRASLVPWINPLLNALSENGFHLSEELKREALRLAGE